MSLSNVREVLWVAIHTLIISDGTLQDRLASAAVGLTSLPSNNDLTSEDQEALDSIIQELTREDAVASEGKIKATTRLMCDEDAKRIAKEIFGLYTKLRGGI